MKDLVEDLGRTSSKADDDPVDVELPKDSDLHSVDEIPSSAKSTRTNTTENVISEAADGGYGWLVVVLATLCHLVAYSGMFAFSILYIEFSEQFESSQAETGAILSAHYFWLMGAGLIIGPFLDAYGSRAVGMFGASLCAVCYLTSAFLTSVWQLFVVFGLLAGFGSGMQIMPCTAAVKDWFKRRQPLALSIFSAGAITSYFVTPPLTQHLLSQYGWRGSLLLLSGINLQSLWMYALCRPPDHMRASPQDKKPSRSLATVAKGIIDFSLLRNPVFVFMCMGIAIFSVSLVLAYELTPSRAYHIGLSREQAARLPMIIALGSMISRPPTGLLGQVRGVNRTLFMSAILIVDGTTVTFTFLVRDMVTYLAFGFIFGWFGGASHAMRQQVLIDNFDTREEFVRSQGIAFASIAILGLMVTPLAGWLLDITGSYNYTYFLFGFMKITGGVFYLVAFFIKRKQSKNRDVVHVIS